MRRRSVERDVLLLFLPEYVLFRLLMANATAFELSDIVEDRMVDVLHKCFGKITRQVVIPQRQMGY